MKNTLHRLGALALAVLMTASLCLSAGAVSLESTFDETYYATLDYYGALADASVVKSYRLGDATSVTDYGTYDSVTNLTDHRAPTLADGAVTFDFGQDAPEKFYFEGKTTQPFADLPWTITVSYRLNGAPAKAEALAGKTGLVEIDLDVLPNPKASAYARTNLVLTAATAFNDDDITSLEAPGAEVQLIGNLRAVLFAVLPGEEQHFALRVGTDSFQFSGLVFLAVPATLQQLDKVADLRSAKEDVEDSYDAISDSLDVILDTLEGMSGSLSATANGLDQLNSARAGVSAGKGAFYSSTDAALSDLNTLAGQLGKMDQYLTTTSQALTDTTAVLNDMAAATQDLKPLLERTRTLTETLRADLADLKEMAEAAEAYNNPINRRLITNLSQDAAALNDEMKVLTKQLNVMHVAVKGLNTLSPVTPSEIQGLVGSVTQTVGGETLTVAEIQYRAALAENYQKALRAAMAAGGSGVSAYQLQNDVMISCIQTSDPAALAKAFADVRWVAANQSTLESMNHELESSQQTITAGVRMLNKRIEEANSLITGLRAPTATLFQRLSDLTEVLGDGGFTDDLASLTKVCDSLMEDLEPYSGTVPALLEDLDAALVLGDDLTDQADLLLDHIQSLDDLLNTYEPQAQAALTDAADLSAAARATLTDTRAALSTAENLLRTNGPALDAGTRQSLSGLSEALRRSVLGLERTPTIRSAKTTISDLIDDQWDTHTGQADNLLLMDAQAAPVSMTSEKNPAPINVQYIMRTQEIKLDEDAQPQAEAEAEPQPTTFWDRVAAMFRDFWNAITGLFRH